MRAIAFACFALVAAPAVAQDAALVNPDSIRVTLDNPRVRVFEAVLPPGAKEGTHSHPASIVHVIEGGTVRNHFPDGSTTDATLVAGTSSYREPLVHWAENTSDTTVRLIVVELKDPAPPK